MIQARVPKTAFPYAQAVAEDERLLVSIWATAIRKAERLQRVRFATFA
jgi:hypothetical protein